MSKNRRNETDVESEKLNGEIRELWIRGAFEASIDMNGKTVYGPSEELADGIETMLSLVCGTVEPSTTTLVLAISRVLNENYGYDYDQENLDVPVTIVYNFFTKFVDHGGISHDR